MNTRRSVLTPLFLGLALAMLTLLVAETGMAQPEIAPAAPASGTSFPIITVSDDHTNPAIAYDEGRNRFLVVYQAPSGGQAAVCVETGGTIVNAYVVGTGENPNVTYSGDHDQYMIVYNTVPTGTIEGQFISGSCCFLVGCGGAPFTITNGTAQFYPAVDVSTHPDHQDYLVVWQEQYGATPDLRIMAQRVLSYSQLSGSPFVITDTTSAWNFDPDLAYSLPEDEFLVVFTHDTSKGVDTDAPDIYAKRVYNTAGGGVRPGEYAIDTYGTAQLAPSVAAYPNATTPYLVAYTDHTFDSQGDIMSTLVATDGQQYGGYIPISLKSGIWQAGVDVSSNVASDTYTLAWTEWNGNYDVYWRQMDANTASLSPIFPVAATSLNEQKPAVAGGAPSPMVVWQQWNTGSGGHWDIYARTLGYEAVYLPLVLRNYP